MFPRKKSTFSQGNSNCVEVEATWSDGIVVTDSKQSEEDNQCILHFSHDEWKTFIAGVKAGEFDIETTP